MEVISTCALLGPTDLWSHHCRNKFGHSAKSFQGSWNAIFKLLWFLSSRVSFSAGSREHRRELCQVCGIPVSFSGSAMSQAPPPGYASSTSRRFGILEVQKDQRTWHRGFLTPLRYKKIMQHIEEEGIRPGLREHSSCPRYMPIYMFRTDCAEQRQTERCVEAEMSHFWETFVFLKIISELFSKSNKICNLSFWLQVQRPVPIEAELSYNDFPQQCTVKTRFTAPRRTGDLDINKCDLILAIASAGCYTLGLTLFV